MPSGGAGSLSDHLWIRKETPRIIFMPMYSLIFMVMTLSHWGYIELYFMLAILENREVCNNLSKFSNTKCSNIIFKVIFCKAWSTLKKQTLYPWKRGEAPPPPFSACTPGSWCSATGRLWKGPGAHAPLGAVCARPVHTPPGIISSWVFQTCRLNLPLSCQFL